jgi:hypothetical protein
VVVVVVLVVLVVLVVVLLLESKFLNSALHEEFHFVRL